MVFSISIANAQNSRHSKKLIKKQENSELKHTSSRKEHLKRQELKVSVNNSETKESNYCTTEDSMALVSIYQKRLKT